MAMSLLAARPLLLPLLAVLAPHLQRASDVVLTLALALGSLLGLLGEGFARLLGRRADLLRVAADDREGDLRVLAAGLRRRDAEDEELLAERRLDELAGLGLAAQDDLAAARELEVLELGRVQEELLAPRRLHEAPPHVETNGLSDLRRDDELFDVRHPTLLDTR